MSRATMFAGVLLGVVAIAHLLRIVFAVDVVIGGTAIPMWFSYLGLLVAGGLSVALFREASGRRAA